MNTTLPLKLYKKKLFLRLTETVSNSSKLNGSSGLPAWRAEPCSWPGLKPTTGFPAILKFFNHGPGGDYGHFWSYDPARRRCFGSACDGFNPGAWTSARPFLRSCRSYHDKLSRRFPSLPLVTNWISLRPYLQEVVQLICLDNYLCLDTGE